MKRDLRQDQIGEDTTSILSSAFSGCQHYYVVLEKL